jgi:hypothetical protein
MTTRTSKHSKVKSQSKTAFVLALPATLSVGEVVKKAKTAGIALSPNYVSNIRSSAKAAAKQKGSGKPGTPKPVSAPKLGGTAKVTPAKAETASVVPVAAPPTLTVTEFIKSQPRDIPAAAVVKAAEKAGLKIDANYVYKVRSRLGAMPTPKAAAVAPQVAVKAPVAMPAKAARAPEATKPAPSPVKSAPRAKAPKSAPTSKATPAPAPVTPGVSDEVAFRKLVVELGVARAEALFVEVKKKLAALFAGT